MHFHLTLDSKCQNAKDLSCYGKVILSTDISALIRSRLSAFVDVSKSFCQVHHKVADNPIYRKERTNVTNQLVSHLQLKTFEELMKETERL